MDENDPGLAALLGLPLTSGSTLTAPRAPPQQAKSAQQHVSQQPGLPAIPEAGKAEAGSMAARPRRAPGPLQDAGSTGNSWSSDLAKLRSEFDSLQQQLTALPTTSSRRESLIGNGASSLAKQLSHQQPAPCGPSAALPVPHSAASTLPIAPAPANVWTQRPELPDLSWAAPASAEASTVQAAVASSIPAAAEAPSKPVPMSVTLPEPAPVQPAAPALPAPAPAPLSAPAAPAAPAISSGLSVTATELVARAAAAVSSQDHNCPMAGTSGAFGAAGPDALFSFPATIPNTSQALQAARQTFLDPELTTLCDEGLHKQLQRTKDGATEASRIQELAGLVKLLRKAVRELGTRACVYVEQCAKIEKDSTKQVESMRLSHESAVLTLEAELAGAKKAQAGWEAERKAERATWGAELESVRYEVSRLKRELERVTEERDLARGDADRETKGRQQAELELKELRKVSSQAMREVAVTQSETVRSISDEKTAAERREAAAKEENTRLSQRLEAANTCIEALQGELALLQQMHEAAKDALRQKTSLSETLQEQLTQAQSRVASLQQSVQQLTDQLTHTHSELSETQSARQVLQDQLAAKEAQYNTATLQAAASEASTRETALCEEKTALQTALSDQLAQRERDAAALAVALRQAAQRGDEITQLKHQIEFCEGQVQDAESKALTARQETDTLHTEVSTLRHEISVKDERLAVLEGEFAALKEVLGEAGGQRDVVVGLLGRISTLQAAAASAEATRRKLHNELVSLRGNVEGKDHPFQYDRVFAPGTSQEEVFSGVSELVQSALDGYHVCLFSYGQTGAGKTYTMQGTDDPTGRGIIPRAVEKIVMTANMLQQQAEWEYQMEASCIEVYNNALRDLLAGPSAPYINDQSAIKHDPSGGHTTVVGVTKAPISDAAAAGALLRRAASNRACESTAMNAESSRSHCVFMLYIRGSHPPTGTQLQGCLCLVDLAGSERLDRSQAEDARKKEACAINQSLSALGDIFAALSAKNAHIPYRNSKLTYLLQPCLGGQGKTLMFVNINPEPASAFESLCSLKFAAKVNGCEQGGGRGGAGAVRRATGPAGSAALPTSSLGGGSGAGAPRSAADDVKRLSLPGPARVLAGAGGGGAGAAGEGAAKRQSMYGGAGGVGGAGVKRPPTASSGTQQGGAKRLRQ